MAREITPLTGLRFCAAFFVCIAHITPHVLPNTYPLYSTITRLSAEGMTLFFVLSGFVIHYNYSCSVIENPKLGLYRFFAARFARLVPLYFLCLFLDLMIPGKNSIPYTLPHLWTALPYYLTLSQSWFYIVLGDNNLIYQFGSISPVAWSISTEWFFYLCYPILCFGLIKTPKIRTKLVLLTLTTLLTVTAIAVGTFKLNEINTFAVQTFGAVADFYTHNQDSFFRWLIYFSPYSRISEFIVGCLIAAIYMQLSERKLSLKEERMGLALTFTSLFAVILTHHYIWNPPTGYAYSWLTNLHRCFGFAPSFAALIFCCARYQNIVTRFLSNPFFMLGGEISYSIYLIHLMVPQTPVFRLIGHLTKSHKNIKLILTLAFIYGISVLSYKLIEAPSRQILRKWLMKKPADPILSSVPSVESI